MYSIYIILIGRMQFQGAFNMLFRGHELELLVSIGLIINYKCLSFAYAVEMLAKRCERLGFW